MSEAMPRRGLPRCASSVPTARSSAVVTDPAMPSARWGHRLARSQPDAGVDELRHRMLPSPSWLSVRELEVPTIAASTAPPSGRPVLALATDLRYAADTAALSVPFTRLGIHAGMAATWLLRRSPAWAWPGDVLTGRSSPGSRRRPPAWSTGRPSRRAGREVAAIAAAVAAVHRSPPVTKVALASGGMPPSTPRCSGALAQRSPWPRLICGGLAAARERRPPRFPAADSSSGAGDGASAAAWPPSTRRDS